MPTREYHYTSLHIPSDNRERGSYIAHSVEEFHAVLKEWNESFPAIWRYEVDLAFQEDEMPPRIPSIGGAPPMNAGFFHDCNKEARDLITKAMRSVGLTAAERILSDSYYYLLGDDSRPMPYHGQNVTHKWFFPNGESMCEWLLPQIKGTMVSDALGRYIMNRALNYLKIRAARNSTDQQNHLYTMSDNTLRNTNKDNSVIALFYELTDKARAEIMAEPNPDTACTACGLTGDLCECKEAHCGCKVDPRLTTLCNACGSCPKCCTIALSCFYCSGCKAMESKANQCRACGKCGPHCVGCYNCICGERHTLNNMSRCSACNQGVDCGACTCTYCPRCNYRAQGLVICANCGRCQRDPLPPGTRACCACFRCTQCNAFPQMGCSTCHDCIDCCGCDDDDSDHIGVNGNSGGEGPFLPYANRTLTFHDAKKSITRGSGETAYAEIVQDIGNFKQNAVRRYISCEIEVDRVGKPGKGKMIREVVKRWNDSVVSDGSLSGSHSHETNTAPTMGDLFIKHITEVCDGYALGEATCTASCGLHVHVDTRDFRFYDIRRLLALYNGAERAIFELCEPRRLNAKYSQICGKFYANMSPDPELFKRQILGKFYGGGTVLPKIGGSKGVKEKKRKKYMELRYRALNLHSHFHRGTIEFRHHEGTTDKDEILNWSLSVANFINSAHNTSEARVKELLAMPSRDALLALLPNKLHPYCIDKWAKWDKQPKTTLDQYAAAWTKKATDTEMLPPDRPDPARPQAGSIPGATDWYRDQWSYYGPAPAWFEALFFDTERNRLRAPRTGAEVTCAIRAAFSTLEAARPGLPRMEGRTFRGNPVCRCLACDAVIRTERGVIWHMAATPGVPRQATHNRVTPPLAPPVPASVPSPVTADTVEL